MTEFENKNVKKAHWAFVVYPESLPVDWLDKLKLSGVRCAISPLHDSDFNSTKEQKKEHYHIIVSYGGPTTFNNVKRLSQDLLNGTIPIALERVNGYFRYMTHKDNPEKAQYSEKDIILLNGFENPDLLDLSLSRIIEIKKQLQIIIKDNHITEYYDFINIIFDLSDYEYYQIASSNTYFFTSYINSLRNKIRDSLK